MFSEIIGDSRGLGPGSWGPLNNNRRVPVSVPVSYKLFAAGGRVGAGGTQSQCGKYGAQGNTDSTRRGRAPRAIIVDCIGNH